VFRHDGKILSADRTRRKLKEGTGDFFIQGRSSSRTSVASATITWTISDKEGAISNGRC